ncbi:MAG: TrpB-like pyridoxal phosphate-dependent enzyme, partial [Candidatus Bathyarchaeia archaeon]
MSLGSVPNFWYNIVPDLPRPLPPPRDPEDDDRFSRIELLPKLFPSALLDQEFSAENSIPIPSEVLEAYRKVGRPTPIVRARNLEKVLDTPAKIYFKREDLSPTGSHKVNTALAQAYYSKMENVDTLVTETSAGQWGSALAFACAMFNIKCLVFMTRSSYLQKPYRKTLMNLYGAEVVPSPSNRTEVGRKLLRENPEHPGSLGIAISEAVETAIKNENVKYSVGSVMNFVLLHQTVIGLETKEQLEELQETPDVIIGCVGGGSNFAGLSFPFIGDKLTKGELKNTRFIAVESKASPKITEGNYVYEHADTAGYLPMLKMFTVGRNYIPSPIHAAGLRYHAAAPTLSLLIKEGIVEKAAYTQEEV